MDGDGAGGSLGRAERRRVLRLVLAGGRTDFSASAHDLVRLELDDVRSVLVSSSSGSTRGVVARIADRGSWVDMPGCGMELGPHGESDKFIAMEGDDGSFDDVEVAVRRYALGIEDAVVTTRSANPVPVSLLLDPPVRGKLVIPPKDRIVIQPGKIVGLVSLPMRVDVARREEMLALSFDFVNMRLDTDASHIVHGDPTKPSYLIVTFPPQSVAEKTYFEDDTGGPPPADLPPVPARVSGPSRLVFFVPSTVPYIHFSLKGEDGHGANGFLDWVRLTPSVVRTAFSQFRPNGPTRLDPSFVNPADKVSIDPSVIRRPSRILPAGGLIRLKEVVGGALGARPPETTPPASYDATQVKPPLGAIEDKLPVIDRAVNPALVYAAIPHEHIPMSATRCTRPLKCRCVSSCRPTRCRGGHIRRRPSSPN